MNSDMNNSDTVASNQQEKQQQQQQVPLDPREVAGTYRPEQPAGSCSFATTDASGYPDRQDGLSAYSPAGHDPHGHHKHHQVPCASSNENSSDNKDQLVNRPAVEVAERLGLGETCLPDQTAVAHFLCPIVTTKVSSPTKKPSAALGFLAGGIAACGAVTITNPAEVIKTRLQLQGELMRQAPGSKRIYTNSGQAFLHIAKYEGIRGLQRGLGCAYMYQIMMNGTRLGLYDPIKHTIHATLKTDPSKNNNAVNIAAGGIGGILSAALASPLFLVKTRLQSYSSHEASRVGQQHYYRHTVDALRHIYNKEGLRGIYRGVDASMMRTGAGSAVQLPLYDVVKQKMIHIGGLENGALCHGLSSLISGFFLCIVMNPFDIISTRMFNQGGSLYKSPVDCLVKTIKAEGLSALYKGFTAHYLRIGPHTIFTFVFMEQVKKVFERFE